MDLGSKFFPVRCYSIDLHTEKFEQFISFRETQLEISETNDTAYYFTLAILQKRDKINEICI